MQSRSLLRNSIARRLSRFRVYVSCGCWAESIRVMVDGCGDVGRYPIGQRCNHTNALCRSPDVPTGDDAGQEQSRTAADANARWLVTDRSRLIVADFICSPTLIRSSSKAHSMHVMHGTQPSRTELVYPRNHLIKKAIPRCSSPPNLTGVVQQENRTLFSPFVCHLTETHIKQEQQRASERHAGSARQALSQQDRTESSGNFDKIGHASGEQNSATWIPRRF